MTGSGPRLFDLGVADRLGDERGLFFLWRRTTHVYYYVQYMTLEKKSSIYTFGVYHGLLALKNSFGRVDGKVSLIVAFSWWVMVSTHLLGF